MCEILNPKKYFGDRIRWKSIGLSYLYYRPFCAVGQCNSTLQQLRFASFKKVAPIGLNFIPWGTPQVMFLELLVPPLIFTGFVSVSGQIICCTSYTNIFV